MVAGERRRPATSSSTDSMNPPLVGQVDDALLFEPSRAIDGRGLPACATATLGVRARERSGRLCPAYTWQPQSRSRRMPTALPVHAWSSHLGLVTASGIERFVGRALGFRAKGKSHTKSNVTKIGSGAAAGALIGGLAGGGKGALIGTAVGAGAGTGVAAATGKEEAVIHAETAITFTVTAKAAAK